MPDTRLRSRFFARLGMAGCLTGVVIALVVMALAGTSLVPRDTRLAAAAVVAIGLLLVAAGMLALRALAPPADDVVTRASEVDTLSFAPPPLARFRPRELRRVK